MCGIKQDFTFSKRPLTNSISAKHTVGVKSSLALPNFQISQTSAQREWTERANQMLDDFLLKGGVGKFEKPARDTLFVIFHGMLLTSR